MAGKSSRARKTKFYLSPINPSIHYILFLIMAFILVLIVAATMQQVSNTARARLVCPESIVNQTQRIEELSKSCPNGVSFVRDNNNCQVWTCNPPASKP